MSIKVSGNNEFINQFCHGNSMVQPKNFFKGKTSNGQMSVFLFPLFENCLVAFLTIPNKKGY